ncbi:MAG: Bifunctional phosphoglucose/phosphomannose isomerase [Candidatus Saccharibacteria bacterium]|nr:Bifunctional phosphoglucose/phosphomannose isomerase [Candidatus Saccharibacteria bacterium]
MLDDLKYIHDKDTHDALGTAGKQWQQLEHNFELPDIENKFSNVVHSGMGGSSHWAYLSTAWPGYNLPFEVVRGYDAPNYVSDKTLFIASSYSGNTEETLSSLAQAEEKGAFIVVISSGGKLVDIAKSKGYPLIELPKIDKPRYGSFYGFRGLLTLGDKLGILAIPNASKELESNASFLQSAMDSWKPDVPTDKNPAKLLAHELAGKSIVMYGGPLLYPAAHKWKISFNENAKNVAWEYPFPEFSHNEFTGWTSHPVDKPYGIVYLLSSFDNDRIKKRFVLTEKLLSGRWPSPEHVEAQGSTKLQHLLWTVALGDFVSLYVAFLNGTNPIEVGDNDVVELFKKELGSPNA